MIPTYNEVASIGRLIPAILKNVPKASVLVVDDSSPDGTAKEVSKLSRKYKGRVFLLLRTKEKGRGSAGVAGFKWALEKGAEAVVEMDADFSHDPKYLPAMVKALDSADVVVGSRFVKGGRDERGFIRTMITLMGRIYIRTMLGVKIEDPTSGFRIFRKEVLESLDLDSLITTKTWAVVQEMLYKSALMGFKIKEVSIVFIDRERGNSKFNLKILIQGLLLVLVLKLQYSSIWGLRS